MPSQGQLGHFGGSFRFLFGTVICAAVLVACHPQAERLIPDRVDVVVSVTPITAGSGSMATLESGEVVSVDGSSTVSIVSHVLAGGLLIRGSEPHRWFMGVPRLRGCFYVKGWGTELGASIVLDRGPVLPEAPTFDRAGAPASQHRFEASGFCLDQQGRVTSVEF